MSDTENLKLASETISVFLAGFPKDIHTNLVLDYVFKMMLEKNEENICPSELDMEKGIKNEVDLK